MVSNRVPRGTLTDTKRREVLRQKKTSEQSKGASETTPTPLAVFNTVAIVTSPPGRNSGVAVASAVPQYSALALVAGSRARLASQRRV